MRNRTALIAPTLAAAGLSLLASACGGSAGNGVAQIGTTTTTTTATGKSSSRDPMTQALAYAACMRTHGVPNFPDPKTSGTGHATLSIPDSPNAKTADKSCRHLLPGGGTPNNAREQAKERTFLLKYAACMRKHGVTDFPDPNNQGMFPSTGRSDRRSPAFKAASQNCQPLAGGFVSMRP
jgi:hypothetical protein